MSIRNNGLVIGTLLAISFVVAGIVASASALTVTHGRPSRGAQISQPSGPRPELEISGIGDYQGLRRAFINSTSGRPR
jgi:hypothetical protein